LPAAPPAEPPALPDEPPTEPVADPVAEPVALPPPTGAMVVPFGVMMGTPVVLAPFGTAVGVVGPVVFGTVTLFGETTVPGVPTAFGETVPPGVTVFGAVFGRTVCPAFTEGFTVVFGRMTVPVGPLLGMTVELGPVVSGATVELGPVVFGATVELGPVRTLVLALVGFCALAAPLTVVLLCTDPCWPD